jgi:hypothetical protein
MINSTEVDQKIPSAVMDVREGSAGLYILEIVPVWDFTGFRQFSDF